jgi:hypothetical protein
LEVTAADFRSHFELLSDEALLETNREDLVEIAKQCFEEEISRRGLNAGDEAPEATGEPASEPADHGTEEVLLATFLSGDEINLVRGLLEGAGIPSRVVNPLAALGAVELRLLVPLAYEEQALEILAMQISDEELAAQAEAAGAFETESAKEEEELSGPDA